MNTQVLEPHRQVLGRWSRVVREEQKRRAADAQRLNEIRCAGNQLILSIDHTIHVDQIARLNHIQSLVLRSAALEEPGDIDELPTSESQAERLPPADPADSKWIPALVKENLIP